MAYDIAIDLKTGDLVWTGINDFGSRDGDALDKQRIHVRLFIERGEFIYDPTNGALGSRLLDILRLPRQRALVEAELYVREALEPMDDIEVSSVGVEEVIAPTHQTTQVLRTNAVRNPSFEKSVEGYAAYQNFISGTIQRSSDYALFGQASCKVTATSSGAGSLGVVLDTSGRIKVAPGEIWTVTSHTRPGSVPRSSGIITGFFDSTFAFQTAISGSYVANEVGKWKRNSDLTVTIPAGINWMTIYTDFNNPANGESHYVDGVMAVKGTSAGAYFDGDSLNADWVGNPHNSESLQYDSVPAAVDQRMIRLNISYHPRFDQGEGDKAPETPQETFSIDVPA